MMLIKESHGVSPFDIYKVVGDCFSQANKPLIKIASSRTLWSLIYSHLADKRAVIFSFINELPSDLNTKALHSKHFVIGENFLFINFSAKGLLKISNKTLPESCTLKDLTSCFYNMTEQSTFVRY